MKYGKRVQEALEEKFVSSKSYATLTPGKAIRIYRELQGLTQSELADKAGLKQATLSALENDRVTLGLDRAKALARALKVHPAVLAFPSWDIHEDSAA